jgi:hypothetical protein
MVARLEEGGVGVLSFMKVYTAETRKISHEGIQVLVNR